MGAREREHTRERVYQGYYEAADRARHRHQYGFDHAEFTPTPRQPLDRRQIKYLTGSAKRAAKNPELARSRAPFVAYLGPGLP